MKEGPETFEYQIDEAKQLLDRLIDPEITLTQSVEVYKKGMTHLSKAQQLLDDAKVTFEELNKHSEEKE